MADRGLARPPNTADKKKKKPKSQGEPGDSKPTQSLRENPVTASPHLDMIAFNLTWLV